MNDARDPHPLFPPRDEDDEDDAAEVVRIHVTRVENGRPVYAPPIFDATELQSPSDIFERYGGGNYELIAKDSRGKISDRRRYELPGPSKPLDGRAPEPVYTAPPPAAAGAGLGGIMPVVLTLAPLLLEWMKTSAASARAQSAEQSQFLLAMMNRDAENARAHVQTMQQLADRSAESQARLFQTVLERSASGDPAELLMRGAELVTNLRAGAAEASAAESAEDTIKGVVEGISAGVDVLSKAKTLVDESGPPPGLPSRPRPVAAPAQQPQRTPQQQPQAAPSGAPPKVATQ